MGQHKMGQHKMGGWGMPRGHISSNRHRWPKGHKRAQKEVGGMGPRLPQRDPRSEIQMLFCVLDLYLTGIPLASNLNSMFIAQQRPEENKAATATAITKPYFPRRVSRFLM